MSGPLLALEAVDFGYPHRPVLRGVDFALAPGERVAVAGDNGAGKTSLLHLLVGLRRPTAGRVWAFGAQRRRESEFREVRARAGLLFQDPDDQLFCPTVLEDVAFGPLNLGLNPAAARERAQATLTGLGLAPLAERITHQLSGGQKRMVSLASVLAMAPDVLLLDEPTNGLDRDSEARLLEHLEALTQSMVFVSHDLGLIQRLASRVCVLRDGRLRPAVLHSHPHEHPHLHLADAPGEQGPAQSLPVQHRH